ncbi:4-coumarate--CoA ligase-like [Actinidia chinensis var. chinensis]|uniref:4-coumarate--CoA ligase-like n=1 Tax=Actinidia chinensis var. chinensis TaxID=1590841 RepID=A0A2R6PDP4_ACTCC|nr:4-coumarate--CoA ligase-like [Actinidia chinensis var. chinensis]
MAAPPGNHTIDPRNGFCSQTKTFHSLRPSVPIPPPTQPLSLTEYTLSLRYHAAAASPPETTAFLIDSASGRCLTYSDFIRQTKSLSLSLQTSLPSLSKNYVAFIIAPPSFQIPVIYFSLLSLGVTISPANPLASESEITHMVRLSKPVIAFATSSVAHKLPSLPLGTILIDSPEFQSMITTPPSYEPNRVVKVAQSDTAAILYSSGTTGRVKGVELTHRNFISLIAGFYFNRRESEDDAPRPVSLFPLPLFHVFGFFMLIRAASMSETLVLMERFDFEGMLRAVEKYKVTYMPVSPPLVLVLAKSDLVTKYDLSSLRLLGCGGAPLGKEVSEKFAARFPGIEIVQGYGLTETSGGATRMVELDESKRHGSVGRISEMMEAKIVDPGTGEALPPGQQGELWLRGPTTMKGYVGDDEATSTTLDPEGWLKTGDLCYFDSDGFLYIVDRLKELIKYKAYQVPPAELEHLLQSNPEIADAAVVPYPDEEAGQIPMAFIVRKPGSGITEAQIMDFISRQASCTLQEDSAHCIYQCHSKITGRKDPKKRTGQSCSLWCFI